jgi:hypothetical protein
MALASNVVEPPDDRRHPARQRRRVGGRRLTDLADPSNPAYMTVFAVARYFSVDRRTVEKWARTMDADWKPLLPIHAFPGCDRIAVADVIAFVAKHKLQPRQKPPGGA